MPREEMISDFHEESPDVQKFNVLTIRADTQMHDRGEAALYIEIKIYSIFAKKTVRYIVLIAV